jgi:lysophospholipid acyltransferase (LPLAT)-like uncharacterized protein
MKGFAAPPPGLSRRQKARIDAKAALITALARLWFGTVRVEILNRPVYNDYFKSPHTGSVVAGSWHRHAIFLFYFFRDLGQRGIMISRSLDGEMTAGIARRFGYTPIRGSSSRGGGQALQEMVRFMSDRSAKRLCGTAVDGPRGPARVLKKGMLALAKEAGAWFVPMACSGDRVLTFPRAWDRTIVPKPFSRVLIDFGRPFRVPADIGPADFEALRARTERRLNDLTDRLDRLCGRSPALSPY